MRCEPAIRGYRLAVRDPLNDTAAKVGLAKKLEMHRGPCEKAADPLKGVRLNAVGGSSTG